MSIRPCDWCKRPYGCNGLPMGYCENFLQYEFHRHDAPSEVLEWWRNRPLIQHLHYGNHGPWYAKCWRRELNKRLGEDLRGETPVAGMYRFSYGGDGLDIRTFHPIARDLGGLPVMLPTDGLVLSGMTDEDTPF